jgi:hypothetical protein
MATRIAARWHRPTPVRPGSPPERLWAAMALVAAAAWIAVAVLQTPRLPLLGLVAGPSILGGILCVHAPASPANARQRFVRGALGTAGLVLVTVGIGHHLELGLATIAFLVASSPTVLRWVAGP